MLQSRLALQQQDCDGELHAELRFQTRSRTMAEKGVNVRLIAADVNTVDPGGGDVVLSQEPQRGIHDGLLDRPAGESFDQVARGGEHPRMTEATHDRIGVESATGRLEETERRFERVVGGRPPERREIGGGRAIFGRVPGVERFRHRSEIPSNAARLRRRNPERVGGLHGC